MTIATKASAKATGSNLKGAATGIALSLAPLAVIIGISAMNIPSAEAYTTTSCTRIGNTVTCSSY